MDIILSAHTIDVGAISDWASVLLPLLTFAGIVIAPMCRTIKKYNRALKEQAQIIADLQDEIKDSVKDRLVLTKSVFAILDGMIQQGLNGPVTAAHAELRQHLIDMAHDIERS